MLKFRWWQERQLKKKCEICYKGRKLMIVPFCHHDPKFLAQMEELSKRVTPYVFTKEQMENFRPKRNND